MSILNTLAGLLHLLPSIFILVVSIILLSRTKQAGAILMVAGQSVTVLIGIINTLLTPFLYNAGFATSQIGIVYGLTGVVGFLAHSTFGTGLLILILRNFKKK